MTHTFLFGARSGHRQQTTPTALASAPTKLVQALLFSLGERLLMLMMMSIKMTMVAERIDTVVCIYNTRLSGLLYLPRREPVVHRAAKQRRDKWQCHRHRGSCLSALSIVPSPSRPTLIESSLGVCAHSTPFLFLVISFFSKMNSNDYHMIRRTVDSIQRKEIENKERKKEKENEPREYIWSLWEEKTHILV